MICPAKIWARKKTSIIGWLSIALENRQFLLHYQPIIELSSGDVVGVEALIRWQHPERGLIHPAEFIPHLENTSLIFSVQGWVINKAMEQRQIWSARGFKTDMAINISARGIHNPAWINTLSELLEHRNPDTNPILLEITESALMEGPDGISLLLNQLCEAGAMLAIDDFGTGYSSLAYLRSLDFDYLKIDQAFTQKLSTSERDKDIVRAILALAEALRMKVIAEGVETKEAYDWLKAENCDHVQGYYIARPMPAERDAGVASRIPVIPKDWLSWQVFSD